MNKDIEKTSSGELELVRQFEYVNSIIERHRFTAIRQVNNEALLTNWEVGQYISRQLKSAAWGDKVVSELAVFLKRQNPKRRGFGKRHLYNMVKFFELYSSEEFAALTHRINLPQIVQSGIAQIEAVPQGLEIVQLPIAQFESEEMTMPAVRGAITFASH
ncbi:MAG: hypothetical protein J5552_01185 [Prevotella sp.]|nr:hypothetical protein [Prevotella sp.]